MWDVVHLTYLNSTSVVGSVVDYKYFLSFRHKRIDADINIDCTRPTEQYRCVLVCWYRSSGACATLSRSERKPFISPANSFSRGQISGTTCAIFTVSVVVAGPGLSKTFRLIIVIIISLYRYYVMKRINKARMRQEGE